MNTPRFEPERDAARAQFLANAGWADAHLEWRPGDASFRRYARLQGGDRRAMLMDAPPPKEALGPFIMCGAMLSAAQITTPQILAKDRAQGFLLLEDFGDATFIEPPGIGALIQGFLQDVFMLCDLVPGTEFGAGAQPGLLYRFRLGEQDGPDVVQDLCSETNTMSPAEAGTWDDPFFSMTVPSALTLICLLYTSPSPRDRG